MDKRQSTPLLNASSTMRKAEVSPDGRFVAYESLESATPQIFVQPFPDVNTGCWQISSNGGIRPVWAPNGRELFCVIPMAAGPTTELDAVTITTMRSPVNQTAFREMHAGRVLP